MKETSPNIAEGGSPDLFEEDCGPTLDSEKEKGTIVQILS